MPKTDKKKASVDTSTSKPMFKVSAETIAESSQGYEPPTEASEWRDPIIKADDEYERLYGWIHKGDVDTTLKAILKELVRIRLGGGHV